MMIITKCPLRISLVGGSTDLESFINGAGKGSVISFPCNKYVYITLHDNNRGKFFVNYSKKEEVDRIEDIQNDVAREVLLHFQSHFFKLNGLSMSFNSDVFSEGGGLATSSAYMIAAIKALSMYCKNPMSDIEICKLALELERKFNPLTGRQDTYGCGMPNFKKMVFRPNDTYPEFTYLETDILNENFMYLIHTGINRSSTAILKSIDTHKCATLMDNVLRMERAINNKHTHVFFDELESGWKNKKKTSSFIADFPELIEFEGHIKESLEHQAGAYKLLGAGGGGYFFVITPNHRFVQNLDVFNLNAVEIEMDEDGIGGMKI